MNTILAKFAAAILFAACLSATAAFSEGGTPLSGIPVGLEGEPGGIITNGTTDAKGNATFSKLSPGSFLVFLPNASKLEQPARLTISAGGKTMMSEPILPKSGKAYAMGKDGKRLVLTLPATGRILVTLETAR